MDINLKDLFSNSFVISINKERYNRFNRIFLKTHKGLPLPKLYYGVTNLKTPVDCCKQSHINVITKAKELDLPYVLVFEDDAYPCDNINEKLKDIINELPNDADLLALGYSSIILKDNSDKKIKNVNSIYSMSGTQSYIVFKNCYDKYISLCKSIHYPIDNRIWFCSKNTWLVYDSLYIQYNSYKNYEKTINNHYGYIYFDSIDKKCKNSKLPPKGFSVWKE